LKDKELNFERERGNQKGTKNWGREEYNPKQISGEQPYYPSNNEYREFDPRDNPESRGIKN